MQSLYDALNEYSPLVTIALIVAVATIFVMVVIITYLLSKTHDRMYRFFGGRSKRRSMEAMLDEYLTKVTRIERKYDEALALIDDINFRMVTCIRKVGVVRYNPFDSMGGDMSFALALLDENDDGLVISTIHARDASYTYAKQVLSGQSSHTLTDEEHEAIKVALEWKPMVDMGTHKVTRESRLADLAKRQRKLNKLHEANTPEPIEALKATKVSKANAKIKASRKKMFSKAVANDVKDAAVAVNQWFDEEPTRKRSVHKEAPLIDDIPDMPGTPLPEPLKDPSPLPKPTPELEQEPSNMQETIEISQDELEEAMENQRAIERLRQKLQDHSHKQSNDQDTII